MAAQIMLFLLCVFVLYGTQELHGGQQPDMDSSTSISVPPLPHINLPSLDVEIDVIPIINAMLSSAQGNFGFMIALQSEFGTNLRNFASSTNANRRPKLTIVYQ
jgi:hypothetical protein